MSVSTLTVRRSGSLRTRGCLSRSIGTYRAAPASCRRAGLCASSFRRERAAARPPSRRRRRLRVLLSNADPRSTGAKPNAVPVSGVPRAAKGTGSARMVQAAAGGNAPRAATHLRGQRKSRDGCPLSAHAPSDALRTIVRVSGRPVPTARERAPSARRPAADPSRPTPASACPCERMHSPPPRVRPAQGDPRPSRRAPGSPRSPCISKRGSTRDRAAADARAPAGSLRAGMHGFFRACRSPLVGTLSTRAEGASPAPGRSDPPAVPRAKEPDAVGRAEQRSPLASFSTSGTPPGGAPARSGPAGPKRRRRSWRPAGSRGGGGGRGPSAEAAPPPGGIGGRAPRYAAGPVRRGIGRAPGGPSPEALGARPSEGWPPGGVRAAFARHDTDRLGKARAIGRVRTAVRARCPAPEEAVRTERPARGARTRRSVDCGAAAERPWRDGCSSDGECLRLGSAHPRSKRGSGGDPAAGGVRRAGLRGGRGLRLAPRYRQMYISTGRYRAMDHGRERE